MTDLPRSPTGQFARRITVISADGLTPEQRAAHQALNAEIRRAAGREVDDTPRAEPTGQVNRALFAHGDANPPIRMKHVANSLALRQRRLAARIFNRYQPPPDPSTEEEPGPPQEDPQP